jgi:undecaprenyl-diphosphatase
MGATVNILHAFFLGVLQGATEFLPVSSSGHLVLTPWLLGWESPGLAFGVVVHWGTALAIVVYFWRDWLAFIQAAFRSLYQRSLADPDARLFWLVVLGTIPAVPIGWKWEDFFETLFARPVAAASFLLVTAALLAASERVQPLVACRRERELDELTWLDALIIGLAQALAIFPGVSRSGATIAAGLTRGLRRESAARFSFLLATPIILGAGLLELLDLAQVGELTAQASTLIVGFLSAGIVGFGCIHFLLRYLQHRRLYPFAVYCAVAGVVCLLVALTRGV